MTSNPRAPEKEKYMRRILALNLQNVGFYAVNAVGVSEEDLYAELNRLHAAPDMPDKKVLGRYSP